MNIQPCSHCGEKKPIVWSDYCYPNLEIKVCYSCLCFLGWTTEIQRILPYLHKCPECKNHYISKKVNSKKCYVCWDKVFNPVQIKSEGVIDVKPEHTNRATIFSY
jgi:hypothetical protein